jgi:hypothetical protein
VIQKGQQQNLMGREGAANWGMINVDPTFVDALMTTGTESYTVQHSDQVKDHDGYSDHLSVEFW